MTTIPYVGELASLAAALIWAFSMILYTGPASQLKPTSLNLFKNLIALFLLTLLAGATVTTWPDLSSPKSGSFLVLGLSGIIGITLGDSFFFAALRYLGAQLTSALQCLAPPLSALLALWFYGETLTQNQIVGLLLTTLAILGLILSHPHKSAPHDKPLKGQIKKGIVWALAAALCQALGVVTARQALQDVDSLVGTLGRLFPAVIGLGLLYYAMMGRFGQRQKRVGQQGAPQPQGDLQRIVADRKLVVKLFIAAFLGSFLGLLLMSIGAKYAKAGVTTALSSTYPLWVIPLARIFLNESTNSRAILWTFLAVIGIAVMMI